jgi:hypothetical protein
LHRLEIPLGFSDDLSTIEQVEVLHQAATNLASCPAWQKQRTSSILLCAGRSQPLLSMDTLLLLDALTPLSAAHITTLALDLQRIGEMFGEEEVRALCRSFGSSITHLHLMSGAAGHRFWPALAECFPAVKSLYLGERFNGVTALQLAMWGRAMNGPLTLHIPKPKDTPHNSNLQDAIGVLHEFGRDVTVQLKLNSLTCNYICHFPAQWLWSRPLQSAQQQALPHQPHQQLLHTTQSLNGHFKAALPPSMVSAPSVCSASPAPAFPTRLASACAIVLQLCQVEHSRTGRERLAAIYSRKPGWGSL